MSARGSTSDHTTSQSKTNAKSAVEMAWLKTIPSPDMNGARSVNVQNEAKPTYTTRSR